MRSGSKASQSRSQEDNRSSRAKRVRVTSPNATLGSGSGSGMNLEKGKEKERTRVLTLPKRKTSSTVTGDGADGADSVSSKRTHTRVSSNDGAQMASVSSSRTPSGSTSVLPTSGADNKPPMLIPTTLPPMPPGLPTVPSDIPLPSLILFAQSLHASDPVTYAEPLHPDKLGGVMELFRMAKGLGWAPGGGEGGGG
jgi:hypothetical protein